ncbi:hypothetical protein ACFU99_40930 [Streptomyces sp. NPDC057654]|uniref:hypothetical protein n=1 Tax=Streptomyces sp. NPDC057654 TaxID=3346196 RepID=UPI003688059D
MSSYTIITKLTDRPVVATCPLGSYLAPLPATRLSRVVESRFTERPIQAPAVVAAAAQAGASAGESLNGAGYAANLKTQHQHHQMWAFRGLEPWRDPA